MLPAHRCRQIRYIPTPHLIRPRGLMTGRRLAAGRLGAAPVLLLTGSLGLVPEVLVAYISSVLPAQPLPSDLILDIATPEFQGTHLKVTSALRLHAIAITASGVLCSSSFRLARSPTAQVTKPMITAST